MLFAVGFIIFWVVCAALCEEVAKSKGHSGGTWLFIGLVCGPIALLAAAGLGDRNLLRAMRGESSVEKQSAPMKRPALVYGVVILSILVLMWLVKLNGR